MKIKKTIVLSLLILSITLTPISYLLFKSYQKIVSELPKLDLIKNYYPYQVSRVFDSANNIIAEFAIEKRTVISTNSLPEHVKNAFIATEDAGFYRHRGIDYFGVMRAILYEIKYRLIGGQRVGGSTITQQTAKTFLLSRERTYRRKIKELILARKIENILTKSKILDLYLNQIYFGNGAYGIEEAAKTYYGISANELNLSQAASLASIPKSPNKINPIKDANRIKQRRDYILGLMARHGFISQHDADNAKIEPIVSSKKLNPYLNKAPHFINETRRFLISELGSNNLRRNGLNIYTTLNMDIQIAANEALKLGLRNLDKKQGYRGPIARLPEQKAIDMAKKIRESNRKLELGAITEGVVKSISETKKEIVVELNSEVNGILPISKINWANFLNTKVHKTLKKLKNIIKIGDIVLVKIEKNDQILELSLEQKPLVDGSVVVINPENNNVLAMVGGYDFATSNFNRATKARRQPGSSFKPFLYAAAIDKGIMTSSTLIENRQRVYRNWRPKNDNGKFDGNFSLRACLVNSSNMCSLAIIEEIGVQSVINLANRAGQVTKKTKMPRNFSLALGTGEVIPLLHVNAFSIFPSAGKIGKPILVEKILSKNKKNVFESKVQKFDVIKPGTAFIMTDIMRGCMKRRDRKVPGFSNAPLAGKTGTTDDFRSAWFVGFSHSLVAGVYIGFDDNRTLGQGSYGAAVALPIWKDLMSKALKVMPAREFMQPQDVVRRLINLKTGDLMHNRIRNFDDIEDEREFEEDEVLNLSPTLNSVDLNNTDEKQPTLEVFITGTEPLASIDSLE